MLTLAFDTATPTVTVALADGSTVLAQVATTDGRRHGELLAPSIDAVLTDAGAAATDLSVIAVGVGPGPFTGLRVGLVTARTLGFALSIPVVGVCTLDLIAAQVVAAGLEERFVVATDARRKEVYWATYDVSSSEKKLGGVRVDGPHVSAPIEVQWQGPAVGAGAFLYPASFPDARDPGGPRASTLCQWVAEGSATLAPLPLYLRRPDAAEPGTRKRVTDAS